MKDYNFLLIEKYIKGDLTPEELDAFKSLLKNGKNFADDVNLYKDIESTLTSRANNQEEANKLKNTLENLGKDFIIDPNKDEGSNSVKDTSIKVFKLQRFSKYLVAASLVLLATIFWLKNENPAYEDFANYEYVDMVVRGNFNKTVVKAQNAFNIKDYENALKAFNILLENDNSNAEFQLYKAICLVELDKFNEADAIYKKIRNGKSIYKNKAIWYLALSKLKQKEYASCKKVLKDLPNDAEDFEMAKKLLDKL